MKKIIIGLLVLCCLATCLTGCGKNEDADTTKGNNDTSVSESANNKETKGDFSVEINGKKINLPCKLADFKAVGLEISQDSENLLKSETTSHQRVSLVADYFEVMDIYVSTTKDNLSKAKVVGVSIPNQIYDNWDIKFNNLVRGESTLDDVLQLFGDPELPEEIDESKFIYSLHYMNSDLIISIRDGKYASVQYKGDAK